MNFYNEIDKNAAQWIRNLIAAGEIPNGVVDERSIAEIQPSELVGFTQLHFFAGVAGWSLALRLAGWPDDKPCVTGSCPCQPFSTAGKGEGDSDERHLWPEFFRIIDAMRFDYVFGEQVASSLVVGKAGGQVENPSEPVWLDGISADLESAGYTCGAIVLPACSVGAPHIRSRLWWGAVLNEESVRRRAGGVLRSVDGLANSNIPLVRGESSTGEQPFNEQDGGTGGMGVSDGAGSQQGWDAATPSRHGDSTESASGGNRDASIIDGTIGMGNATGDDEQRDRGRIESVRRPIEAGGSSHGDASRVDGVSSRLGDSIDEGLEGHGGDVGNGSEPGRLDSGADGSIAASGAWSDYRVIACRDGKNRRTQRGLSPLASGIPRELGRVRSILEGMGHSSKEIDRMCRRPRSLLALAGRNRVGRLKGYGNSIVPVLGAEFIRAFMESVSESAE